MATETHATDDYWVRPARTWALRGSPLRPAEEDVAIYERGLRRWHGTDPKPPLRALLLGVTPELAALTWPAHTMLVAADLSRAMIRGVWPGAAPGRAAVCARWEALPLRPATQDIAIGDGCFSALTADRYAALAESLRRVVRPRGQVLMRFFTRPDRPEMPAQVFADLHAGRIGSFHAFKWRLAMALHGSLDAGVRVGDIWNAWNAAGARSGDIAQEHGWPLPEVLTIDDFRGVEARYTFPTLTEARAAMGAGFEEISCDFPGYELGERCPIMAFRPRP